jgi:N-acetyl-alpha-D-glucosaminyl L-malate synthase BshA
VRIGVTCYPSIGGSGIVATEVGMALARRGHEVHFVCAEIPRRLEPEQPRVHFHPVRAPDHPVFAEVPYALALSSALVSVAQRHDLELLHAHYAVPHATSAWMAREVLRSSGCTLRVVSTLHGTDITQLGSDESYLPITRHSLLQSDSVTTPSAWLRDQAHARLQLEPQALPIEVIPNFVDTTTWRPLQGDARPHLVALFGPEGAHVPVLVHVSNFRPVKRAPLVVDVFERVLARTEARLLLVGEGPELPEVEASLRERGLLARARLVGEQRHVQDLLRECAVFLLPSESESFGLAALEALASGVPVVASAAGGLPEVIRDGETGYLVHPQDLSGMASRVLRLLCEPRLRAALGEAARQDVLQRFPAEPVVARYEALYSRLLRAR